MTDLHYLQIAQWREEIARVPEKRLYHRLADALLKAGRPHDAYDIAVKGLFIHDSKYWACVEAKGAAELTLGRYADAVLTLRPLTEQLGNPENRRKLAMALYGSGKAEEAEKICKRILQSNPFDNQTQRLLSKGRAALPDPITHDAPLPEIDESPAAETDAAPSEPASPEPEEQTPSDPETESAGPHLRMVEDVPEEVEVFGEEPEIEIAAPPEEVEVFGAEPESEPEKEAAVAEPAPVEPTPSAEKAEDAQVKRNADGVVLHQIVEDEKPFAADVAPEADAALARLFDSMTPGMEKSDKTAADFTVPAQVDRVHADIDRDELGRENDPTEGMDAEANVEEMKVFGEIGGDEIDEEKPGQSQLKPSPASEATTKDEQTKTDAPRKKGFFRRIFRSRRHQKENQ